MEYVSPQFEAGLGYRCGRCGSTDDWIETPTDVGCARCGTAIPHGSELDSYYRFADANPAPCRHCGQPFTGLPPWGGHRPGCDYAVDCR